MSTDKHAASRLTEEAAWVSQALAGDEAGFAALMRRYEAPLRRVLRAILRNPQDTDDLLQETFFRAYRFLHRFDPNRPFGPWLFRIGTNLARNHLRGARRRSEVSLDEPAGEEGEEQYEGRWLADDRPLRELEGRRMVGALRDAIAELPADQRVVLEMRILGELSYKEIAASLGVPIGTVMSRLNRGRERLQQHLRTKWGDSGESPDTAPRPKADSEVS